MGPTTGPGKGPIDEFDCIPTDCPLFRWCQELNGWLMIGLPKDCHRDYLCAECWNNEPERIINADVRRDLREMLRKTIRAVSRFKLKK